MFFTICIWCESPRQIGTLCVACIKRKAAYRWHWFGHAVLIGIDRPIDLTLTDEADRLLNG